MRRLLLAFALLAVPLSLPAQDREHSDTWERQASSVPSLMFASMQDTAIALPDTVAVDTVAVPPVALPDSPSDFINRNFTSIILLVSAIIMWGLVKFVPGFDVARDLVKYGVYGASLMITYVVARYVGGTVPEGLSDLVGTFIEGLLPMLITAFGGVSLYNLSMSQKKMVNEAREMQKLDGPK